MLPKLRRSLQKNEPNRKSPPVAAHPAQAYNGARKSALEAPRAVIKALYDYSAQNPGELSFSKGDFFHVVGNEQDPAWFEASNPMTNQRGLVPASYFQTLGRTTRENSVSTHRGQPSIDGASSMASSSAVTPVSPAYAHTSGTMPLASQQQRRSGQRATNTSPLYGVVMYDFEAERPDELDAKAGEAIIIIAQSNHEWFVAKPIGRLGGPGLIPVSFIEIRDMVTGKAVTNLEELVAQSVVPKVEEWKKAAAEYRNNSIPLGRFDFAEEHPTQPQQPRTQSLSTASRASGGVGGAAAGGSAVYASSTLSDPITRRSEALFVVRASVDQFFIDNSQRYWFLVRCEMNDGRHRNLCRYYEDFYDFQIALLDEFPVEAGRTGEQRILPFMPGPLSYVDDTISAQRRADLDIYVQELCQLPAHVTRHALLHSLFDAREGDVESSHATSLMPQPPQQARSHLGVSGAGSAAASPAMSGAASSVASSSAYPPRQAVGPPLNAAAAAAATRSSAQSASTGVSALALTSALPTTGLERGIEGLGLRSANSTSIGVPPGRIPPSTDPPTSGPPPTQLKIKIFHDDDLIAIRVPSDITFDRLCEKVRSRLFDGSSTTSPPLDLVIRYRDPVSQQLKPIASSESFTAFLASSDKLVLYVQ
ncbi:bud emergence protein 1 [Savitreella phatthalungensis]